jgi:DNA-nicking Smr family endonuclease
MRGRKETGSHQHGRHQSEYRSSGIPELDLHRMTVIQAERAVDEFLRQQRANGVSSVKIITGFGTGRVKNGIEAYLRTRSDVKDFFDSMNVNEASILVQLDLFED